MKRVNYTREDKITYYINKCSIVKEAIKELQGNLKKHEARLAFLQSDKYQDWNDSVSEQLARK